MLSLRRPKNLNAQNKLVIVFEGDIKKHEIDLDERIMNSNSLNLSLLSVSETRLQQSKTTWMLYILMFIRQENYIVTLKLLSLLAILNRTVCGFWRVNK